jgi:hypothetical protein
LRAIREIANAALAMLSSDFAALYSGMGRPSIAPEKLLRWGGPNILLYNSHNSSLGRSKFPVNAVTGILRHWIDLSHHFRGQTWAVRGKSTKFPVRRENRKSRLIPQPPPRWRARPSYRLGSCAW